MIIKTKEKIRAIALRREGKTYSEILAEILVAKSTLSLWLRDVGLAKSQKQRITQLRIDTQKKGAARRREQRIASSRDIFETARKDITVISERDLWLIGIILYWAEGSKQKDWNVSQSTQFTNSDPVMIKLFIKWLTESIKIQDSDIILSLAIHENNKHRLKEVIKFWSKLTGFRWNVSDRVYFKRHKPNPGRHNLGESYYGTLRVTVRGSTVLNRRIDSWVKLICEHSGV